MSYFITLVYNSVMKLLLLLLPLILLAQNPNNFLYREHSPYLLQHKDNPVNWLAWNEAAFEKAKKEHKPIFLSIGYSTCHWCHVMAHESFENKNIAALINRDYIAIKVDKEELSHIDAYYQQLFLKVKHRSGGWPLTILLTEDKKPFYIAGYLPPHATKYQDGLDTLLPTYAALYKTQPQEIKEATAFISAQTLSTLTYNHQQLQPAKLFQDLLKQYDDLFYGFDTAPKFPEAGKIDLLFDLSLFREEEAEAMAVDMLRAMSMRGLYDQINGGFFRYSTDGAWEIPHFEKMLYNQAELVPLYVKAYQLTKEPLFKEVVTETLNMTQKRFGYHGLFFSASDADTHHEEGGYFTFSLAEVKKAAQNDAELLEALDLSKAGNFEGKVHLNFYSDQRPKEYKRFRARLQKTQEKRDYPFVDQKLITAWNMMMVSAYAKASEIDVTYKEKALKHFKAIFSLLHRDNMLYHYSLKGAVPTQAALLEDHAFSIKALIDLYEITYDKHYLKLATTLTKEATKRFYKDGHWYLSETTPRVEAPLQDKYYTSAYATMMQNLLKMASLTESLKLQDLANRSLFQRQQEILQDVTFAPASVKALLMQKYSVVLLKNSVKILERHQKEIRQIRYPYLLTKPDSSGLFLACRVGSCFVYSKDFLVVKKVIEGSLKH